MRDLAQFTAVADEIRDILGDAYDDTTFWDTLEGETDVMDVIGKLLRERLEAKAQAAAMQDIERIYAARKAAAKKREDACRAALGKVLVAVGQDKVKHPEGTVYFTPGRERLEVTDPDEIPSQLCKRVPDEAAVKAQLAAGETVPGARLVTGDRILNVRT